MRRNRRVRAAAVGAVAVATLLSGCSGGSAGVHPGAAAIVGDQTISQGELDNVSHDLCVLNGAGQVAQGAPNADVAARPVRTSALDLLVKLAATEQLAAEQGVTVSRQEIRDWVAAFPPSDQLTKLKTEHPQAFANTVDQSARLTILIGKLGEIKYREQHPDSNEDVPPNEAGKLGQDWVMQYLDTIGAKVDPRYGDVIRATDKPGTGSMSVAVSDEAKTGLDFQQGGRLSEAELCS